MIVGHCNKIAIFVENNRNFDFGSNRSALHCLYRPVLLLASAKLFGMALSRNGARRINVKK